MFKELLKSKGLSVTRQRITILNALKRIKKPATVEMIKTSISENLDRVTIYRSLSILVDKGIIYQTDFREGMAYFELQQEHHHHHLVCTQCKTKTEFSYCPNISAEAIKKENGFLVQSHVFEIFGICKKCAGKES